MEQNNTLNETHQNSKKELADVITVLQQKLDEQKSNEDTLKSTIENLRDEAGQKSVLLDRVKDLEEQLAHAETRAKEEVLQLQKDLDLAQSTFTEQVTFSFTFTFTLTIEDMDTVLSLGMQCAEICFDDGCWFLLFFSFLFWTDQKEKDSQKELEKEAALKHLLEELETKNKQFQSLEIELKELEQKLKIADDKSKEKVRISEIYFLFPLKIGN